MSHPAAVAGPDPRIFPFPGVRVSALLQGRVVTRTVLRVHFSPFARQTFVSYFRGEKRQSTNIVSLSCWREFALDGVLS